MPICCRVSPRTAYENETPALANLRAACYSDRMERRLIWLTIYAVTMAYLESAVVVYLREIYYPQGFDFPLAPMPQTMMAIEIGREAATVVMLLAVAGLTGRDRWERFFAFSIAFGVWDLFYYVWLWVFLRWPASLFTWDVLFLIPVPWLGPVLAPVLISIALIVSSVSLWRWKERGVAIQFAPRLWALAIAGGIVVLLSFMIDYRAAVDLTLPAPFRWDLFTLGFGASLAALALGVARLSPVQSRSRFT